MHCSLFLTLFATACLGSYTCCAAGQIARSSDGWSGTIIRNLVFAVRKPIKKHGAIFHQGGKPCSALCRCCDSPSIYPLMTLPVWCPVIIPSSTSIAHTLRKEFASRQKRLYKNIYIENTRHLSKV